METALTVLLWVIAIGVGLWLLSAIVGAVLGVFIFKKANDEFKDFDNDFFSKRNKRF